MATSPVPVVTITNDFHDSCEMEWVAYKREGRDGGVAYREGEEGVVVVQRFVIRSMKTKRYMKAGLCEIGCTA